VGYIAFSPLAMGLLSGKYADGALPAGSRFALYERYRQKYAGAALAAKVRDVADRARAAGVSPAAYAFAWVLSRPAVASVLSSASQIAQLEAVIAAADLKIDFDRKGSEP
jgi:aryl-alcohol dehydrogenase-like predicted oxidoreductase